MQLSYFSIGPPVSTETLAFQMNENVCWDVDFVAAMEFDAPNVHECYSDSIKKT